MIYNYLLTAIRNILRNKLISIVSIFGLSIGFAVAFFVLFYATYEFSYDTFHAKKDKIFRVISEYKTSKGKLSLTCFPVADMIRLDCPEIEKITRVYDLKVTILTENYEEIIEKAISADYDFFQMFSFPILQGNEKQLADNPQCVVISEKIANKYFNGKNPIGEKLTISCKGDKHVFIVAAVMKDFPGNSTIKADIIFHIDYSFIDIDKGLISTSKEKYTKNDYLKNWQLSIYSCFILIKNNISADVLIEKFKKVVTKNTSDSLGLKLSLQKIQDINLYSEELSGKTAPAGNLQMIYIFSIIGTLILFVGIFNYLILTVACIINRNKEFGLRKMFGAQIKQFFLQFFLESLIVCLTALPVALILVEQFFPLITKYLGNEIKISYINNLNFTFGIFLICIISALLSSIYISYQVYRFQIVNSLKKQKMILKNRYTGRKIMIIFQLVIFIVLVFSSFIFYLQIDYIKKKDLNITIDHVVVIPLKNQNIKDKYLVIKDELLKMNQISAIAGTMWQMPTDNTMTINMPVGKDDKKTVQVEGIFVTEDFPEVMDIKLMQGRTFKSVDNDGDFVLINQSAVKLLNLQNPIGYKLSFGEIIGVVQDFNIHSLRREVPPLIIGQRRFMSNQMIIKLKSDDKQIVEKIKRKITSITGERNIEVKYLTDLVNQMYKDENQFGYFSVVASLISIILALIGLFGFTYFIIRNKTKEIGIRKVNGAGIIEILLILIKGFSNWIIISLFIAFPIGGYIMNQWLQSYVFHTDIYWWIYVLTAFLTFAVCYLTVGYHVVKTASANPVDSLRYE